MILGIGVDIVEIERIRKAIERSGPRFVERVFTRAEETFCRAHRDPAPHYAARFAAKEALLKALGTGWAEGVKWQEVEVERASSGAPHLVLRGEVERRCREIGATAAHCSLTHSELSAVAVVILEK
jgi:holo-[acyl-carrier protein] synthase